MGKIPGVNHLDAIRALEKAGFRVARQGKHTVMPDGLRILVILRHNPINAFTTGGIVRDVRGISQALVRSFLPEVSVNPELRYEIILYWSAEDQAFIAEVPELPGCAADGATYGEAVVNAQLVIQEWIETARALGRPVPEPKGRLLFA